jgi:hypothetical protein
MREKNLYKIPSVADPDPGSGVFFTPGIRNEKCSDPDPGWKMFGSGSVIKHPGSATLVEMLLSSTCECLTKRIKVAQNAIFHRSSATATKLGNLPNIGT